MGIFDWLFGEIINTDKKYPRIKCPECGNLHRDNITKCSCGFKFPLIPQEKYNPEEDCIEILPSAPEGNTINGDNSLNLLPATFVQIDGDTVRYNVNNLAEAKIALKELKLKKKEFGVIKRDIAARQKAIRASYTHEVRNRGSMVRGGGGLGKFIRHFQTASRDSRRSQLANELAPFEIEKQKIEGMIGAIESLIVQLEVHILRIRG